MTDSRPQRGNSNAILGFLLSVEGLLGIAFALIVALAGTVLSWQYNEALKQGRLQAERLAHVLTEHLGRTIATVDATLIQLALHGQRVGGPDAPPGSWNAALAAARAELHETGSISVLDAAGVIRHSTIPQIVGEARGDRFLFKHISQETTEGLVADTPIRGVTDGRYFLPFGRRLVDGNGRFAGVLVLTILPDQLRGFYRSVGITPSGMIAVLHPAGLLLFQEPSLSNPLGQIAAGHPVLQAHRTNPHAGFLRTSEGAHSYLTAYRQAANPPLIVAVSLGESEVLREWRRMVWLTIAMLATAAIVLTLGAAHLRRMSRGRTASQRQLAEKVTQLEHTISERDAAGAALIESQRRFQAIMDQAPVMVFVKDLEGRFTFLNHAAQAWAGMAIEDTIGKKASDILTDSDAANHEQYDRIVMEKREPIQRELDVALRGQARRAIYNKFPMFDSAGKVVGIGTIIVDVTAQKQLEAQLVQSQKMEAVGQLTGGIAHDFNNLLTAILLNADILASRLPPEEKLQPLAQTVLEAAERGAELTKRLLAFSRRQMLEARPTDINTLVIGMETLMQRSLGEDISISLVLTGDLQTARVDANQLEAAILNLALNARDAMPQGGRLTIETANVVLDEAYAASNADVAVGPYVMVAVTDTGTGMPADVAARAFEPFFTTKGVGKGTGLGLSMIYGFVKQSGGHVKIYSEPAVGTCIKLYLPPANVEADAPARRAADTALPGGNETVLLVEDDQLVRKNTEAQLLALGYRVVVAEAASGAVEHIEGGLVPDLLFTDVVMPGGVNGFELARRVRQRLPGLRVLFSSGYTHGAATQPSGEAETPKHFLGKPFRRRDLAAKVREALDDSEG